MIMLDESTLNTIKGALHSILFLVVLLPYYYLDAIISLFLRKEPKSVEGEIVLITGIGHGIGRLLAIKYASEGATVVGWDINEELCNETIAHIKTLGYPSAHGYKVDVANRKDVMATAKKVQEEVGNVTILINNAGIMPHHSFLDHTEQEIRRIMDINIMGNFWTLQAFLPHMKKQNHGHVVALSSMAGLAGHVYLAPYNAAKFAVRGLMEGLREEFRRIPNNNVHFTTIYPFMVDTGLCKLYDISYPSLYRMLKQEYVADKIFESQVFNKKNVVLPPDIGALLKLRITVFPEKACNYTIDNFKAELMSDLDLQSNGYKKNM